MEIWENRSLEDLENEIWLPLVGYEDLYNISNLGRIKSLEKIVEIGGLRPTYLRKSRIMKTGLHRDGYIKVTIQHNKKRSYYMVHRLVGLNFIPNLENKPQINHKNGVKYDNRVENLEWCNASENGLHAHRTGLATPTYGEINGQSKLTEQQVREIRAKYTGKIGEIASLAEEYGISYQHTGAILHKRRWKFLKDGD